MINVAPFTDQHNQHETTSITPSLNVLNIPFTLSCIEPVCGGGRFWTSQAGDEGQESGQNIFFGTACERDTARTS